MPRICGAPHIVSNAHFMVGASADPVRTVALGGGAGSAGLAYCTFSDMLTLGRGSPAWLRNRSVPTTLPQSIPPPPSVTVDAGNGQPVGYSINRHGAAGL